MDTGDANDFKFSTKKGENIIYIAPGRAILGINDQSISTAEWQYSYGLLRSISLKRLEITIEAGSTSLLTGTALATSVLALLAF